MKKLFFARAPREAYYWILFFVVCFAAGYLGAVRPELRKLMIAQNRDFYILATDSNFISEKVRKVIDEDGDFNIHVIIEPDLAKFTGQFLDNQKFDIAFVPLNFANELGRQNLLHPLPSEWEPEKWIFPDFIQHNNSTHFLPLFWYQTLWIEDPDTKKPRAISHTEWPKYKGKAQLISQITNQISKSTGEIPNTSTDSINKIHLLGAILPKNPKDLELTSKFLRTYLNAPVVTGIVQGSPWASTLLLTSDFQFSNERRPTFLRTLQLHSSHLEK